MPRKVRVTTTSFFPWGARRPEENRADAAAFVDAAGRERADLVCLPETLLQVGVEGSAWSGWWRKAKKVSAIG